MGVEGDRGGGSNERTAWDGSGGGQRRRGEGGGNPRWFSEHHEGWARPVGGPLWVNHRLCCLVGLPRPIPSFGFDYDSLF